MLLFLHPFKLGLAKQTPKNHFEDSRPSPVHRSHTQAETRAWTVSIGSTGPQAVAVHSDFQTKYIRAQVVAFEDLVTTGSKAAAKEAGKLGTEGKEYIVKDGDVIEFMHS